MTPNLWSLVRSGVIAVGLTGVLAAPSMAAPLTPLNMPVKSTTASDVMPVARDCRGDDRCRRADRRSNRRHFDRDRSQWNDGRRFDRDRFDWNDRRHNRRNWRRYDRGPSIYFNFGVPLYRYAEPHYVEPRYVAPRRIYRSHRYSSAHVEWCYDRYRSYRAYDNTFQPYYGRRQQCWSPYS